MYEHASSDDLVQIFTDTVVMYRKKPVYVHSINYDKDLILYDMEDMKKRLGHVNVEDVDLDFTPVPLGFCNHNKDAFYVQRMPKRQYKQGLCKGNIVVHPITNTAEKTGVNLISSAKGRSLAHCIEGNYPTLESAVKMIVEDGCRSAAFSRKLAIDDSFSVYFKTERVGILDEDSLQISFLRNMKYLKEVIHA